MAFKNHKKINIGIFGFGNMGQAILRQLEQSAEVKKNLNFLVYSIGIKKTKNAACLNSFTELIKKSDFIFLCVKPQNFYNLKTVAANDKTFISIMAGVKINNIKKIVNSRNIIRAMPNLPLVVGQGVIAWFADEKKITKNKLIIVKKLFSIFGDNFKVEREADLDKITAISGSGPAYIFLFMDALIKASVNLGFSQKKAEQIILQLMTGSIEYFKSVKNIYSLEKLIQMVKSKKGTTEAALNKLNTTKFYKQWQLAISQAHKRAKQISNYDIK